MLKAYNTYPIEGVRKRLRGYYKGLRGVLRGYYHCVGGVKGLLTD